MTEPIGQIVGILASIDITEIINRFDDRTDEEENFYDPALLERYINTLGRDGAEQLLMKMADALGEYIANSGLMNIIIEVGLEEAGLLEKLKAVKGDYENPAYDE